MRRFVASRRAFLLTAALSTSALAVRVAMLPRPLSEAEIDALASLPPRTPAAPPPIEAGTNELDYDLSRSMPNSLAAELELGPVQIRWQRTFRINTVERDPRKGVERWSLLVDGLVGSPDEYRKASLDALGRTEVRAPFQCVEGWGLQEVRWDGVPLRRVLERARPAPDARFVTFHTLSGVYSDSLTLEDALRPDVLLSDQRDGAPLPENQGLPLRLVVPFMFGYKSAKWVNRIELTARRHVGFWERRGWPLDPLV